MYIYIYVGKECEPHILVNLANRISMIVETKDDEGEKEREEREEEGEEEQKRKRSKKEEEDLKDQIAVGRWHAGSARVFTGESPTEVRTISL